MRPLDTTDRALLRLLRHNARASVTELAATLGASRVTVSARMEALRRDGIIRRFTVEVSDAAAEERVRAISLLELHLAKTTRVARALTQMPEVTEVHSTNGRWALVVHSETDTLAHFDRLLHRIGALDGVSTVETCLLLSRLG